MDGLRAKSVKTVGSSSTVHLYDGQMPVCEQEFEDGVLKQTRIHLLGARGIEGIITVPATGAASLNWLLYDGHGNMVRTMNTAFALSGFQWRGVWGERTNSTPGRGYCAHLGHPEDETGLVYMRARYYEPTTGRFISEDHARDGVNWYLYADGNPVDKVDFEGKESQDESIWIVMGYLFAATAVAYTTAGFKFLEEFWLFAYLQVFSGVFAVCAVYSFFRGLGGSKDEWTIVGFVAGTLFARSIYSYFDDVLKSIESFGKLGKAFGVFGLSAASAAAGYALAVTAALLLTEVVK